ncbi:hypothetical protein QBC40DRAFT_301668 [Triangularia verruculosa]|uniref:Uncharacterized protein n=1 Tax=Triangularia verruculosa TaxID=2587418 RepID=A0AAN7APS6_9PEZI|nr:hypothetical protein QBC40DRAFT_301668 [Triangularia verruculosa]
MNSLASKIANLKVVHDQCQGKLAECEANLAKAKTTTADARKAEATERAKSITPGPGSRSNLDRAVAIRMHAENQQDLAQDKVDDAQEALENVERELGDAEYEMSQLQDRVELSKKPAYPVKPKGGGGGRTGSVRGGDVRLPSLSSGGGGGGRSMTGNSRSRFRNDRSLMSGNTAGNEWNYSSGTGKNRTGDNRSGDGRTSSSRVSNDRGGEQRGNVVSAGGSKTGKLTTGGGGGATNSKSGGTGSGRVGGTGNGGATSMWRRQIFGDGTAGCVRGEEERYFLGRYLYFTVTLWLYLKYTTAKSCLPILVDSTWNQLYYHHGLLRSAPEHTTREA